MPVPVSAAATADLRRLDHSRARAGDCSNLAGFDRLERTGDRFPSPVLGRQGVEFELPEGATNNAVRKHYGSRCKFAPRAAGWQACVK